MSVARILEDLGKPAPFVRPMPFWFWNGKLDADLFIKQLDDMAEKGIGDVFLHPMPQEFRPKDFVSGIEGEYLGREFMAAVRAVVEAAAQRGMRFWLYDEGGWPSGVNLGRVVAARPDLKGKVARYNEEGNVEFLERGYPVDLLDPETTQTFISQVHEEYAKVVGEFFGTTIPGIFTDEPRYGGRVGGAEIPWTPKLPEIFKEKTGYDISLALPILFGLKVARSLPENKRAQVQADFYRVITELWRDSYFKPLHDWCAAHNLLLVGHLSGEDDLPSQLLFCGNFFTEMEYFDWPGIDVIWRQIFPGNRGNHFPKYASSAAHTRGKRWSLSESFAVYGWDLTYAQMKWITDYQYVRGINTLVPMALYSDTRGARKIGTMSDQFQANPLWEHYRPYAEYVGRLGGLLSAGKPVVEVGLYYPIVSLWAGEDARSVEAKVTRIATSLLDQQIDFDFMDDAAIARAEISGGTMAMGDCCYSAIVVPNAPVMPVETMRRLVEFAKAGGSVTFYETPPHFAARAADEAELAQLANSLSTCVASSADWDVALGMLPWTVKLAVHNANIRAIRRSCEGTEIFFLTNESLTEDASLRLRLPVQGAVVAYDPDTEQTFDASPQGGFIRVTVRANGCMVLLAGNTEGLTLAPPLDPLTRAQEVSGPWIATVTRQWAFRGGEIVMLSAVKGMDRDAGGVLGTPKRVDTLEDWDKVYYENFCGTVDYATSLPLQAAPPRALLDLGTVGVVAEVDVNGTIIGKRLWAPYTFDITSALKVGTNNIRISVTSTLFRLMTMPEIVGELKQRGWFNSYAQKVSEFKGDRAPAGLIGPVRILT